MLAGVCGGLGEYFDLDPVIWRIIFLAGIFAGGVTIVMYLIMMLIVPEREGEKPDQPPVVRELERNWSAGLVLVVLGAVLLLQNIMPAFNMHVLWPILLIAAGIGVLFNGFSSKK